MQVLLDIPDNLAANLIPAGQDPARTLLEDLLVMRYREEKISGPELMAALGIQSRLEFEAFLRNNCVWINYSVED